MARRKDKGRARSNSDIKDNAGALPTGIDGTNAPTNFHLEPSLIEDVDRAMFDLFESKLRLEVHVGKETIKVKTLFATGERAFLVKGDSPPRDNAGAFILPIASIKRTSIDQSPMGIIQGRGVGQNTGDLVIKQRLSPEDSKFQQLINKINVQNQNNVATSKNEINDSEPRGSEPGKISSRRSRRKSIVNETKELLSADLSKNIYEIITMPFPSLFTIIYEVSIWTQYQQHINYVLERIMTSYDAQGRQFHLQTDKGHWYVAYASDDIEIDDNFSDFSEDERIVRCKIKFTVPAYIYGNERYGSGKPYRSYLSAPQISFGMYEGTIPVNESSGAPVGTGNISKFTLSDVEELDKRGDKISSTRNGEGSVIDEVIDPLTGKSVYRHLKILSTNRRKGETVMSKRLLRNIGDINS